VEILTASPSFLPWHVRGPYLESCNCDPICPCRQVGGRPGGRSTHGICLGALGWLIEDGGAGDVELSGLATVLAFEYSDDEPGAPWSLVLYVDERGDEFQRAALEAIFLGRLGGRRVLGLPWVRKPVHAAEVRARPIEIGPKTISVGKAVRVQVGAEVETEETVTCVIPGHDRPGRELHGEVLQASDLPFEWRWTAVCAFASSFDYRSDD
jgi:hypothetical protein